MIKQRKPTTQAVEAVIQAAKSLDAFPKIEDDYVETSSSRGTLSILIFFVISVLTVAEIRNFYEKHLDYHYEVDFDYTSKLKLNIDMTVATRCELIGADVMDSTSVLLAQSPLNMTNTWFEMSPKQKKFFDTVSSLNDRIRQNYHALHAVFFRTLPEFSAHLPKREVLPSRPMDACRIHGTLELNKVLGIFHVISGKAINFMGQHAHSLQLNQPRFANFSHRIDNFSFGENTHLVHNALNYDLRISGEDSKRYAYFISVVAVEIGDKNAYQYSVTETESSSGDKVQSGIYFKYDISPIKVKVTSKEKAYIELLIPLIGLIGGIFATSAMLNSLFESAKDYLKDKAN